MGILIRFVVTFIAVFAASAILPANIFHMSSIGGGLIFAAVLGLLNALVRPVVMLLTCPIQLLTLGLSALLINAAIFLVAANVTSGVTVGGFLGAIVAAVVVSVVSWAVSIFVKK